MSEQMVAGQSHSLMILRSQSYIHGKETRHGREQNVMVHPDPSARMIYFSDCRPIVVMIGLILIRLRSHRQMNNSVCLQTSLSKATFIANRCPDSGIYPDRLKQPL